MLFYLFGIVPEANMALHSDKTQTLLSQHRLSLQDMISFEIFSIIVIWQGGCSCANWQDRPFSSNFSKAELEKFSEMSMIEEHFPNQGKCLQMRGNIYILSGKERASGILVIYSSSDLKDCLVWKWRLTHRKCQHLNTSQNHTMNDFQNSWNLYICVNDMQNNILDIIERF